MREIKFRQRIGDKFYYWGIFDKGEFRAPVFSNEQNFANTPHDQYTGLKDKKGKEIYAGDIVKCSMSVCGGGTLPHRGEIVYVDEFGAFGTKNEAGETLLHNHCLHTMEIIGNIYENPGLLE